MLAINPVELKRRMERRLFEKNSCRKKYSERIRKQMHINDGIVSFFVIV